MRETIVHRPQWRVVVRLQIHADKSAFRSFGKLCISLQDIKTQTDYVYMINCRVNELPSVFVDTYMYLFILFRIVVLFVDLYVIYMQTNAIGYAGIELFSNGSLANFEVKTLFCYNLIGVVCVRGTDLS